MIATVISLSSTLLRSFRVLRESPDSEFGPAKRPNGVDPVRTSKKMVAILHTSLRWSISRVTPLICSGLMYIGVPITPVAHVTV